MSQLVGTWVYGDSGKVLQYTVTEDGVALDVTNATSITLTAVRMASGSDVVDTVSGSVASPGTNGTLEWTGDNALGTELASPTSRQDVHVYECRISFVLATKTYWTDPFRIAVVSFP